MEKISITLPPLLKKILTYILVTGLSIVIGTLLSYVVDLAGFLGLSNAHDMGLGNFFLFIQVSFIISQITLLFMVLNKRYVKYALLLLSTLVLYILFSRFRLI